MSAAGGTRAPFMFDYVWLTNKTYLIDADLRLHVLQAFLYNWDECCWWHQGAIYVGLTYVTFYTKCERWMWETCKEIIKEQCI